MTDSGEFFISIMFFTDDSVPAMSGIICLQTYFHFPAIISGQSIVILDMRLCLHGSIF